MTTTPSLSVEDIDNLDDLYAVFDDLSVEGGWHRRTPALWPEPRRNFLPHVWRYADVKAVLEVAGRLVDHQMADRRNLTLTNPVEGNLYATVRTLVAAYQLIKPGEVALAHHHTPAALRIILDGHGTYTVVDGDRVEMRPGDVLLTPSWALARALRHRSRRLLLGRHPRRAARPPPRADVLREAPRRRPGTAP